MKKIIGAVLAGSLLAGMAAADPAITLQYRMRGDVVKQTTTDLGKTTNVMDLDGYGANADKLNVTSSTDKAGVSLSLWPAITGEGAATVGIDEYYGWVTVADGVTIKAGAFDDRIVNRLNTNATQLTLLDSLKPGVYGAIGTTYKAYTNGTSLDGKTYYTATEEKKGKSSTTADGTSNYLQKVTFKGNGVDATDFGTGTGGQTLAIEYKKDGLVLKAGALDTETKYSEFSDDKDKTNVESGYMVEGAYTADGVIGTIDALWRTNHTSNNVIGAYWMPKLTDGLETTFGFTYEMNAENSGVSSTEYNAWAADARARYAVTDAIKATVHFNYSNLKVKDVDAETAMYVIGGVAYTASDAITLNCDAGLYYTDLDDNDKQNVGENTFCVFPSVKFVPAKGATLAAGLKYTAALNTGDIPAGNSYVAKSIIEVPFVFRVQL